MCPARSSPGHREYELGLHGSQVFKLQGDVLMQADSSTDIDAQLRSESSLTALSDGMNIAKYGAGIVHEDLACSREGHANHRCHVS